jgi:NAD+ kinase
MDAICLVPMHPHTLSSRPIVVSGSSEVCIRIHEDNRTQPMVSADGKPSVPIEQDQRLYIRKHPDKLTLLHPPGFEFYEACRTKLHWNVHAEEFSLDSDDDDDIEIEGIEIESVEIQSTDHHIIEADAQSTTPEQIDTNTDRVTKF